MSAEEKVRCRPPMAVRGTGSNKFLPPLLLPPRFDLRGMGKRCGGGDPSGQYREGSGDTP